MKTTAMAKSACGINVLAIWGARRVTSRVTGRQGPGEARIEASWGVCSTIYDLFF
jgi:hypothetical protein